MQYKKLRRENIPQKVEHDSTASKLNFRLQEALFIASKNN